MPWYDRPPKPSRQYVIRTRRCRQRIAQRLGAGQAVETVAAIERLHAGEVETLLGDDGFLVLPTVPGPAPLAVSSPEDFGAFRERAVRLSCWSGLSGFPQITLPLGSVAGAPFGISLLGPRDSDRALIRLGATILDAAGQG